MDVSIFRNKYLLIIMLLSFVVITTTLVYGTSVNVNVVGVLDSAVKEMDCCLLNNNVMTASYDVFNSGSIAYAARIRFDIFNGSEELTSVWSREYKLNPGQRDTINLYWYEPSETMILAKARLYRAYDIVDLGNVTWEFNAAQTESVSEVIYNPENVIEIDRIHVYDNKIYFRLTARDDIKKIIVYPTRYTKGWLFEQTVIENIVADKSRTAFINYDTGAFFEDDITLIAVSHDGRYYGEKTFLLEKESGLKKWLNMLIDMLNRS